MKTTCLACSLIAVLTGCQETMAACDPGEVRNAAGICVDDPTLVDAGLDAGMTDAGPMCPTACTGETPYCFPTPDGDACVECRTDEDCGGDPGSCNQDTFRCPECATHADCLDPTLAQCSGGFCTGCNDSMQCDGFAPLDTCDMDSGECVECTPDTEVDDCGTNSCDPVTLSCTSTPRGSLQTCFPCLADSECMTGRRCIELDFPVGTSNGFYCMPIAPGGGCNTATPPFRVTLTNRDSRSGAAAEDYCGVNEMLTTCDAVIAALTSQGIGCTAGSTTACPEGGRCAMVVGGTRCTYDCTETLECPTIPALMNCPIAGGFCGGT